MSLRVEQTLRAEISETSALMGTVCAFRRFTHLSSRLSLWRFAMPLCHERHHSGGQTLRDAERPLGIIPKCSLTRKHTLTRRRMQILSAARIDPRQ